MRPRLTTSDPTRIQPLISTLQNVWEARPELTLGELMALLRAEGLDQLASDSEAHELLQELEKRRPVEVPHPGGDWWRIRTDRSSRVPVDLVITGRGKPDGESVCGMLVPQGLRPHYVDEITLTRKRLWEPLRFTDGDGITHRGGVIIAIEKLAPRKRVGIGAATRLTARDLAAERWWIELADGRAVELGEETTIWETERRSTSATTSGWGWVQGFTVGAALELDFMGEPLGTVTRIALIDAPIS